MLHLRTDIQFHSREHLKRKKNIKKDGFYAVVDDPLDSVIKDCIWGYSWWSPKDALSDLHKDAQESVLRLH